ncbi:hypothetical protein EI94DRAFT_1758480 [Lactarius quietus]|nr:hypothetical protein EI94DRAFT_1758480 [Lactarius quietus]
MSALISQARTPVINSAASVFLSLYHLTLALCSCAVTGDAIATTGREKEEPCHLVAMTGACWDTSLGKVLLKREGARAMPRNFRKHN